MVVAAKNAVNLLGYYRNVQVFPGVTLQMRAASCWWGGIHFFLRPAIRPPAVPPDRPRSCAPARSIDACRCRIFGKSPSHWTGGCLFPPARGKSRCPSPGSCRLPCPARPAHCRCSAIAPSTARYFFSFGVAWGKSAEMERAQIFFDKEQPKHRINTIQLMGGNQLDINRIKSSWLHYFKIPKRR